jgi:DNA-directed RNA polymerase specialized sigma24 family protein
MTDVLDDVIEEDLEEESRPKLGLKRTEPEPAHKILREVFRHYTEFQDWVAATGDSVIEHGYFLYDEENKDKIVGKVIVVISFWDLHDALQRVADRKKEAVYYNVIRDMKQKDVANIMGITTVSVGQYVKQAMIQMSKEYFSENGMKVEYYV